MGRGDRQVVGRGAGGELRGREVVVEDAVARAGALLHDVLAGAEAVDVTAEVLEVDVEERVAALGAVGERRAVAEAVDLLAPHGVHDGQVGGRPVRRRRGVGTRRDVVDAQSRVADRGGLGDGVAEALRVAHAVGRTGQHAVGEASLAAAELGLVEPEVAQRERGGGVARERVARHHPARRGEHLGRGGLAELRQGRLGGEVEDLGRRRHVGATGPCGPLVGAGAVGSDGRGGQRRATHQCQSNSGGDDSAHVSPRGCHLGCDPNPAT